MLDWTLRARVLNLIRLRSPRGDGVVTAVGGRTGVVIAPRTALGQAAALRPRGAAADIGVQRASPSGAHGSATAMRPELAWLALCAVGIMAALALRTPLNHDEGQYVAAADLVARGLLPYRDFPYLQTPLQPLLLAPIALMASGWTLVALRLVNALCAALAILLIGRTASALARDERAGALAMLLALVADPVLFAGTLARNDALPLLLLAGALERAVAVRGALSPGRLFAIGLLSAAAASAKINYAFPAAAICAQVLWRVREPSHRRAMLALLAGASVGALPTLGLALLAPRAFVFQVYTFNTVAAGAWAAVKGQSWRLSAPVRIAEWTAGMIQGPLLAMLVAGVAIRRMEGRLGAPPQPPIALGPVVAAATLATLLPTPSLRQYLIPLAAPLIPWFVALAWPKRNRLRSRRAVLLIGILASLGVARSVQALVHPAGGEAPLRVEREAHLIGRLARRSGATRLATLEPVHAVDSGIDLDPRFATGQFLFRAGDLPACADPALCPITTASIGRLRERPPGAILTGTQHKHPATISGGLDGLLDRWAADHRYRAVAIDRTNLLWLAPPASRSVRHASTGSEGALISPAG